MQMILVSVVMLSVIGIVFVLPLLVTGNLPLPCCERFDSYKYGSALGIALLVVAQIWRARRRAMDK